MSTTTPSERDIKTAPKESKRTILLGPDRSKLGRKRIQEAVRRVIAEREEAVRRVAERDKAAKRQIAEQGRSLRLVMEQEKATKRVTAEREKTVKRLKVEQEETLEREVTVGAPQKGKQRPASGKLFR